MRPARPCRQCKRAFFANLFGLNRVMRFAPGLKNSRNLLVLMRCIRCDLRIGAGLSMFGLLSAKHIQISNQSNRASLCWPRFFGIPPFPFLRGSEAETGGAVSNSRFLLIMFQGGNLLVVVSEFDNQILYRNLHLLHTHARLPVQQIWLYLLRFAVHIAASASATHWSAFLVLTVM